ncbi:MAG TPA: hypothetical protein VE623_12155 [Acidimicrobiales bacterium]|jgi:hypothetical protein|nr:hypothetical protein [Acidimicrobiales bacterium]
MRKFLVLAVAVLSLLGGVAIPAAARGSATPYCGIRWGSLPEQDSHYTSAMITNLRAGRHECFDRLVIDLGPRDPGLPGPEGNGYQVRYVSQFTSDPSGKPIPLAGAADLSIVVHARAVDDYGRPTYRPANAASAVNVAGFSTFRQVVFDGTFEGQTQIGLGVRARLPFRVFSLAGPGGGSRLVIDVAHRW